MELEPPPQPIAPIAKTAASITSIDTQRRRRDGMPNISSPAKTAPPPPSAQEFLPNGSRRAVVEAAVVFTVKTVVPVPSDAIVTLAGFKLQVGRLCAPVGLPVRAQVRFIVPENVLPAVRVTVAVALAPGDTADGAGAVITAWETVTVLVPLAFP